ncbi:hypothetical protein [Natronobacterium texcoconense]|uniref:Uncharacterized protein n=1 Tax=Natronobacterium texcoconense TaxID=1095778 RepID=A0A1H1IMJ1_NATTX|nr:hypothetical protein [Natronobacterium texcoconense]SDR38789.1 hypothetical protein SAMN04489842_3623 [Natronobacterium texcoconense]
MEPTQDRDRESDERKWTHKRAFEQQDSRLEPAIEPTSDRISLYIFESGSEELLDAVYDADGLALPAVGDRLSITRASADGDLETDTISYREQDESRTYVVERRDLTYLYVDYDVDGLDQERDLVSELRVWVTAVDGEDHAE